MFLIYKHTNLENGMIYIGHTKRDAVVRWQDGHGYKSSSRFFSAIIEYGWKHFSHEIIEDNIKTKAEALQKERYWIQYYDSINPSKGYNTTLGNGNQKRVKCLETQEIFNSITEAAKWCKQKDASTISGYLHGKGFSAGRHPITNEKLHWELVD